MRRADIVRLIRPLQLALALTPVVALLLPFGATHAASRTDGTTSVSTPDGAPAGIARSSIWTGGEGDGVFTLYAEHSPSSLDNATGFRCAR